MRWPWQRRDHGTTRPEHPPSPPVVVAPPPMGWAFLPPLQRQVAEMPLVTRPAAFPSDLPAWRNPSFTGTLGHRSSADAPSGVIDADGGGAAAPQVRAEPVDLTLLAPEPVHPAPVQRATAVPTDPAGTGSPSTLSTGTGSTPPPRASLTTATPAHLPVLAVASYDTADDGQPDPEAVPADERPSSADDTAEASLATPMVAVPPPHTATPQVQRSVAGDASATPPRAAMPLVPPTAPTAAGGRRLGLGAPLPAMPPATEVPAVQRSASLSPPRAGEGAEGYVEVDIPVAADRAEIPSPPREEADAPTLGAGQPERITTEVRGTSDHPASETQASAPALPLPAVQRSSVGGPDEGSGARPGSASPSTAPTTHPGEPTVVDRPGPDDQVGPDGPASERPTHPVQRAAESAPTAPTLGARSTPAPASGGGPVDITARGGERTAGPELHLQRSLVTSATSGTDVVGAPQPPNSVGTAGGLDTPPAGPHLRPTRTGDLALQRSPVLDAPGTGPGAPGDGEPAGELPPPGPVAAAEVPVPRRDPTSPTDIATPAVAATPSRPTLAMHGPVTTLTTNVQRLVADATGQHQHVPPSSSPSALRAPSAPRADRTAGSPVWAPAQLPTLQRLASLPAVPGLPRVPSVPGPGMLGETPTLPALPDAAPAMPTAPPLPMAPTLPTAPAVSGLPATPAAPAGPMTGSPWADQGLPMPLVTPTPAAAATAITPTPSAVQETPATAPETAVPPASDSPGQEAAEPGSPEHAAGPGAGAGAGAAVGASSPEQLEALAQRLFSPLMRRIRAEMLLDRERRGLRTDSW